MLKAVFIGSKNEFDDVLVHWLSRRVLLRGVVWTKSSDWFRDWRGKLAFARKRIRRNGLVRTADETLFYLCYHGLLNARSEKELKRRVIDPYWEAQADGPWQGDAMAAGNVNSPDVLAFIERRRPDVILAMCTNDYFGKRIRSIPRHGVFLWHEGITPEYKGLYAPFWAAYNLDLEKIGYTLLRMNDDVDAGEIFVQGPASGVDPLRQTHDFMGHKAIFDSLPAVEKFLDDLGDGTARPIDRPGAAHHSYTYPGISHLVRQRLRLRRYASAGNGNK